MVFEEVQELIVDMLDVDASEITMDTNIKDDLKADSLDLYEIVYGIEERYQIEIPTDELTAMKTVGDIVRYIEKVAE